VPDVGVGVYDVLLIPLGLHTCYLSLAFRASAPPRLRA
jgi:hypothetical protein